MRYLLLCFSLIVTAAAAPDNESAEPVSIYQLRLREEGAGVAIEGSAHFPVLVAETRAFNFSLTSYASEPHFRLRCGGERWRIIRRASVERQGDRVWTLSTGRACPAGRQIALEFRYRFDNVGAPQLRVGPHFAFAGSSGELWYPQRDYREHQIGRIEIEVPPGTTAIASGDLTSRVVTAGSERYFFDMRSPAKFAFAFGPYAVAALDGPPPVRVLSTGTREEAEALVAGLEPLIHSLRDAFGQLPFDSFSLVETDFQSRVLGTSEYGMIFADPSKMSGAFDAPYWAHELGHQWWGVGLSAASGTPGATMLTEGLAQYGALVALEASDGIEVAAAYRRQGRGDSRSGSLFLYREQLAGAGDRAIADFQPQGQDEVILAHQLATTKGAIALRYLASLAGTDRLNGALTRFFANHRDGRVGWADLEMAIDRDLGGEYRWFLDQWFHRSHTPMLMITYCLASGHVWGEVRQDGEIFRLPLPVELSGPWGHRRTMIAAHDASTTFSLNVPGPVTELTVDPDALVPTASTTVEQAC